MRLRVGPLLIAAEMQVEHRDGRAGRQLHLVFYLMLFDGPVAEIAEDPAAESGPRAARSLVRRTRGLDFQSIRDLSGNAHRTPPVSGHHPLHNVMYSRPMTDSRQRPIVPGAHFAFAISDERYAPRVPRSSRLAAQLLKIDYGASVGAGMRGWNRGHERMSADGVTLVTGSSRSSRWSHAWCGPTEPHSWGRNPSGGLAPMPKRNLSISPSRNLRALGSIGVRRYSLISIV